MNILSIMRAATLGNIQRLRPMILWTIFEYLLRGAPYGILLGVVWELFKPFAASGAAECPRLAGLSAALAISGAFVRVRKRTSKMYYETYDLRNGWAAGDRRSPPANFRWVFSMPAIQG